MMIESSIYRNGYVKYSWDLQKVFMLIHQKHQNLVNKISVNTINPLCIVANMLGLMKGLANDLEWL